MTTNENENQLSHPTERMLGLDLFSGVGGISVALSPYVTPVAYCENDRYAQGVLLSRMWSGDLPEAPIWDDVLTLSGAMLPQIDIIYGGFPCQDISIAGRGAGLGGKRSGLFFEIVRLIGEIRPCFVFLENVPAIRIRGGDIVAKELARLGYDSRWATLSAADVGANHHRKRWWLLAHANSGDGRVQSECGGSSKTFSSNNGSEKYVADAHGINETSITKECQGVRRSNTTGWWRVEPHVGRVAHGVPQRVDRLRGLGNSVVPVQAREAFERLMGLK